MICFCFDFQYMFLSCSLYVGIFRAPVQPQGRDFMRGWIGFPTTLLARQVFTTLHTIKSFFTLVIVPLSNHCFAFLMVSLY